MDELGAESLGLVYDERAVVDDLPFFIGADVEDLFRDLGGGPGEGGGVDGELLCEERRQGKEQQRRCRGCKEFV